MTRREAREQAFILVFVQAIRGEPMDAILLDAEEARDFPWRFQLKKEDG